MQKLDIKKFGWVVSIFLTLVFVACFFLGLSLQGDQHELHLQLMRISYLKFSGLNVFSFISGAVQTFVWGWIIAGVFGWLWNTFTERKL